MTAKPAVQVVIAGDTKGLEKSLKKSGGALGDFGKTALGVFGGLAIAKGVELAVDGVKALANFALDGVEKLDALGDSTARLDGLARDLGKSATAADLTKFGVDKGEQAEAALAIAKTAKALGLTRAQIGKTNPQLVKMAAQLASLGDGDPAKQAELLAKALDGSSKAAKALGVKLPKDGGPLDNYRALVEKLGPKLDKATSGTASLADVGDRWDATLANLQLELAGFLEQLAPVVSMLLDALLPVLKNLVDEVGPLVAQLFGSITEAMSGLLASGSGQGIADLLERIGALLGGIAGYVVDNLVPAFARLVGFVAKNVLPVFLAIAAGIADNVAPLLPKVKELADALLAAFDELLPVLELVWGFIATNLVPILTKFVLPVLGKILGIVLDLAIAFVRNLVPAIKAIAGKLDELLKFLQPVFDMLSSILDLAGDVIGKVGNIHIPGINAASSAAPSGRSGGTANITIQTGVGDPVAIGRQVAKYLGAWQLRGGVV